MWRLKMHDPLEKLRADVAVQEETQEILPTNNRRLDVRAYLSKYGVEMTGEKKHGSSILYTLKNCLFDSSHNDGESAIGQRDDGMLFYHCFHNSCKKKKWEDAKRVISGSDPLFEKQVQKVKPSSSSLADAHISNLLKTLKKEIIEIHEGNIGIDPGFDFLRESIHALMPTHLHIVGGYTSSGKTQFIIELLMRIYEKQNPEVLLFSTEMSASQYLMRLIAWETEIPTLVQQHYTLTEEKYMLVQDARRSLAKKNLYIYDDVYDFERIEKIAETQKKEKGLDIIFLDYIQNLMGGGSIYERMSILSPKLQLLAKKLKVCFVALSQVSNESMRGDNGIIGFKGAGEIAATADLALWLTRISDREVEAKIRKNRHGKTGSRILQINHNWTRVSEDKTTPF